MNRCVEETANDPRDSLSRYLAPLTYLRFEPLSHNLSPPGHVFPHYNIDMPKAIILYKINQKKMAINELKLF